MDANHRETVLDQSSQRKFPQFLQPQLSPTGRAVMLAPLAGVSDHPFRRVCSRLGADLTYVEMLSATAILYNNRRTYDMMERHPDEGILGVQVTGKTADEVGRSIAILNKYDFDTIDLNMGCPVTKVTKNGSGSAILKDPERVRETVRAAVAHTDKPVSVKIRLGWDASTVTCLEVAEAAQSEGAVWLTLHGRLRADDYSVPVNLAKMAEVNGCLTIPFIGNGNIFCREDADHMTQVTGCDGVMVSRGALGNPWVFRELKQTDDAADDPGQELQRLHLEEWLSVVLDHLKWQAEAYGESGAGALCMRKHLLWYLKGWPGGKRVREQVVQADTMSEARGLIEAFADDLQSRGQVWRGGVHQKGLAGRFVDGQGEESEAAGSWDPKYDMDRKLDRGVGHLGAEPVPEPTTAST